MKPGDAATAAAAGAQLQARAESVAASSVSFPFPIPPPQKETSSWGCIFLPIRPEVSGVRFLNSWSSVSGYRPVRRAVSFRLPDWRDRNRNRNRRRRWRL